MPVPPTILQACEAALGKPVLRTARVGGGDINEAACLHTVDAAFFLKYNRFPQGKDMLRAEAQGLQLIADTGTLKTPSVLAIGEDADGAWLLLEFLESTAPDARFWETFGAGLATLHRQSAPQFGLSYSNFIGRLPQPNQACQTWADFYRRNRLQAQVELAEAGQLLPSSLIRRIDRLAGELELRCPVEAPALIHGDLWRGNFLCTSAYGPVLIDPAPSFAHREMDLAMARLFGGFDERFFRAYESAYPTAPGLFDRLPIYQLYYLLVHLNLFGRSYLSAIEDALEKLGL